MEDELDYGEYLGSYFDGNNHRDIYPGFYGNNIIFKNIDGSESIVGTLSNTTYEYDQNEDGSEPYGNIDTATFPKAYYTIYLKLHLLAPSR